ncbi:cytochrome c oxidase subunit 1 [Tulasnella sp. 403]|nr:cytochrome c oxidase subunit 1 [Tulasnella sp. 403]
MSQIGIEYKDLKDENGNQMRLQSARTDAENWRSILIKYYNYKAEDIVLMTDSAETAYQPTYENIERELKELVRDVRSGDRRFLFVACHVRGPPERSFTELDFKDEAILTITPWEGRKPGVYRPIKDNDIKKWIVDPLVSGSFLTAVIDTCHSGTLLDLPYQVDLSTEGEGGGIAFKEARRDTAIMQLSAGSVVCVSACADHQEAMQYKDQDSPQVEVGALSLAMQDFFEALNAERTEDIKTKTLRPIPIRALLQHLRKSDKLKQQTPWVTCSNKGSAFHFSP